MWSLYLSRKKIATFTDPDKAYDAFDAACKVADLTETTCELWDEEINASVEIYWGD